MTRTVPEVSEEMAEAQVERVPTSGFEPSEPTHARLDEELTQAVAGKSNGVYVSAFLDGTVVMSKGAAVATLKIVRELLALRSSLESGGVREAVEAAAKLCDDEADLRIRQSGEALEGSVEWGIDTHSAAMAQGHKAITARNLAERIRAMLPAGDSAPATPVNPSE